MDSLKGNPLPWLLDETSPGTRYLAMRDWLALPADSPELLQAQHRAHTHGPIATVLDAMKPEGYWEKPGSGYGPKYRSTVWAIILLAQLGAHRSQDERIARGCTYLMEHTLTPGGQFSTSAGPAGTIDCLQGNLSWALLELGVDPAALEPAFEWMARTVTGEGLAPTEDRKAPLRYYGYKCGPEFACSANNRQPCAWGAVKVMLAFSRWPADRRTPLIERAIQQGIEFLLGTDPARAEYPSGDNAKPSGNWWKFGFPIFYVTDLLQNVEALVRLGCGSDPRLRPALELILEKQDSEGRWTLEYDYKGKTWGDFGTKKQPNRWVTLRALRVLKQVL